MGRIFGERKGPDIRIVKGPDIRIAKGPDIRIAKRPDIPRNMQLGLRVFTVLSSGLLGNLQKLIVVLDVC